jgi:hypothetical protein
VSRTRSSQGNSEELEELDEGAIIAHQAAPHAPQRRAQVADESRSIVIAEEASQPASRPYRADRGEPTVVIRDRRSLDAARRKILAELHGRQGGLPRAVWFGIAFAMFAIAGSLFIVWLRTPRNDELVKVVAPAQVVHEVKVSPAPVTTTSPSLSSELPTPKISLEELPLERRPRRRQ